MTSRDVAVIALRLFALWLLVQVILNIPSLVVLLTSVEQYQGHVIPKYLQVLLIGSFIFLGLLTAFLIWIAAKSALARCAHEAGELSQQGQIFLLQLGGVYFFVTALAYLPRSLGFLSHSLEFSVANMLWPLGLVFQLCIGLDLLVRSSQWAKLLAKLRGRA